MSFRGKRALITGGSRGIGKAIAIRLAKEGVEVIINYLRNTTAALQTVEAIRSEGGVAHLIKANVGDPKAVKVLFSEINAKFLPLDMLIHCAAIGTFKPLSQITAASWDMTLAVNAKALFLCAREFAALKSASDDRVIVSVSSIGSTRYVPNYGAIGISKAALESTTRYLAAELAARAIRVNAVSGGPVQTDALKAFPEHEKVIEACIQKTPLHRLGNPEDIANVVLFLCNSNSRWICGQTLIADGGLSLVV